MDEYQFIKVAEDGKVFFCDNQEISTHVMLPMNEFNSYKNLLRIREQRKKQNENGKYKVISSTKLESFLYQLVIETPFSDYDDPENFMETLKTDLNRYFNYMDEFVNEFYELGLQTLNIGLKSDLDILKNVCRFKQKKYSEGDCFSSGLKQEQRVQKVARSIDYKMTFDLKEIRFNKNGKYEVVVLSSDFLI